MPVTLVSTGVQFPDNSIQTIAANVALPRSVRSSNTVLGAADRSTLIAITSGTFTQTFTAAATLGSGWFCYIQNSGTGDITLDPNASETIDGLTSYIMYPGEARLVQCDGSNFNTIVINAFSRTFTASGTFTKPPGYLFFSGLIWGGGGAGVRNDNGQTCGGGGGGGCVAFILPVANVSASQSFTIGAGGAAGTNPGGSGGNSTFTSTVTAFGGAGAQSAGNAGTGGKATGATFTRSAVPDRDFNSEYIATTGDTQAGGPSYYAGGTGSGADSSAGGYSVYGGGGGSGGRTQSNAGGTSVYGGAGGGGGFNTAATAGTAPGGGGGGARNAAAASGARGELRIWGII